MSQHTNLIYFKIQDLLFNPPTRAELLLQVHVATLVKTSQRTVFDC